MALSLLASLFDSLGMEEAGEAVRDISGAIMMVGTALSVVSGILPVVTALTGA
mgnify:CR=1 FL=1